MKNFQELWRDPDWRVEVNDWTRDALAKHHIRVQGELLETQVRPWSIVLHALTDQGKIYFKATPPESLYESALTENLSGWFPGRVPEVLATEHAQGWWLARDGGESIRDRLRATRDLSEWIEALQLYAQMQISLAGRVDEMRALGVPDRRPQTLPEGYVNLLADTKILRIDLPKGMTADEYARLRALTSPLDEWCSRLAESKIPASIHHGDLNSGNVLKREGQYAFVDWGDASLAHPFSSLRTVLVSVEIVLDLADNDRATAPLRDAYLNAWTHYAPLETIQAEFRLAHRLSSLVSSLSWYRGIVVMPDDVRADYEHIVPSLLQEFLHADLSQYPFI